MPALKPGTIIPTPAEDILFNQAAYSDPDARPFTDQEWEAVKTTAQIGQQPLNFQKISITIDLDAQVLAGIKKTGSDWKNRINDIVREYIESHPEHI